MATQTFSQTIAAQDLRKIADETIEDTDEVVLVQTIADYIESTQPFDGFGRITGKAFYAEIAMAYLEGYEHATGETQRGAARALRAVGLSI